MNSGFRDAICLADILFRILKTRERTPADYTWMRRAACKNIARAADLVFILATQKFYRKTRMLMAIIALTHVLLKMEWIGKKTFRAIAL